MNIRTFIRLKNSVSLPCYLNPIDIPSLPWVHCKGLFRIVKTMGRVGYMILRRLGRKMRAGLRGKHQSRKASEALKTAPRPEKNSCMRNVEDQVKKECRSLSFSDYHFGSIFGPSSLHRDCVRNPGPCFNCRSLHARNGGDKTRPPFSHPSSGKARMKKGKNEDFARGIHSVYL